MKRKLKVLALLLLLAIGATLLLDRLPLEQMLAQIPAVSAPSPFRVMEFAQYGGGSQSFLVSTMPAMRAGVQVSGFASCGGTTATLNTASTDFCPADYPVSLTNNATSITVTTLSTSNVAFINVVWSDGTLGTQVAPPVAGSSTTFTTAAKSTSLSGFTLVVVSAANLAANSTYVYQGTFATTGN